VGVLEYYQNLEWGAGDSGGLDEIAAALGGEVDGRKVLAPSPGMPADDRSMVIFVDPARPENFYIYACEGPWQKAKQLVAEKLKLVAPMASASEERSAHALRIWGETVPGSGTPVERYLRSRSIDIPIPSSLRFHPQLRHGPSRGTWPAMVGIVSNVRGYPVAIHRTWLQNDGRGKAPVELQKMTLGPIGGCAIRLGDATDHILVGEGIETCLSGTAATGLPSWCALSAVGIRSLNLPPEIGAVTILADGEDVGEAAARAAAARWQKQGRRVRIARPPPGLDFNDVLMGRTAS
jgi:hypothetical protein